MANQVEQLSIQLNLDAGKVIEFFKSVSNHLNQLMVDAKKAGFDLDSVIGQSAGDGKKAQQGLIGVSEEANKTEQDLNKVGEAGTKTGNDIQAGSKKGQNALKQLDSVGKRVFSALKSYIGPLVAMFGVKTFFTGFLDEANKLHDLSKSVRMNVNDLDAWRKANVAAGGSAEAFSNAMKSFTERTGASGETFLRMGSQLNGMTGQQAEHAMKYLGLTRESASIFLENNKRMKELVGSYRELALTPKDAENARRFRVAWQTTGMVVQSIGAQFARFFLPIVESVVEKFKSMALFINKHSQFIKVSLALISAAALATFGPKSILAMAPKVLALLTSPIGLVVAGLILLAGALDDLITFAKGGNSVFEELLKDMGMSSEEIEDMRKLFNEAGKALGELGEALKPVGKFFLEAFGSVVTFAIRQVVAIIGSIAEVLAKGIVGVKNFKDDFVKNWDGIKAGIKAPIDWIMKKIQGAIDLIKNFKLPDWVTNPMGTIKGALGFGDKKTQPTSAPGDAYGYPATAVSRSATVNSQVQVENNVTINGNADPTQVKNAVADGTRSGLNTSPDYLSMASQGVSY